jgi:poly [ADP-ribose] polymerase
LPLGKLSKDHVKKGYQVLQEISTYINAGNRPPLDLSNQFYSLVPHVTAGMRPPPAITTVQQLKEKIAMVESLADIELATKLLRQASTGAESELNPIDVHHDKLKCTFEPVDKKDEQFKMVQDYVKNTHGHTHKTYSLEVLDLFALDREGETSRFNAAGHDKTQNTQLLWHGSRLTNFVGILSQGLRIAPPEAPVTGQSQTSLAQLAGCRIVCAAELTDSFSSVPAFIFQATCLARVCTLLTWCPSPRIIAMPIAAARLPACCCAKWRWVT